MRELVLAATLLLGCGREGVDLLVRVEDRSCGAAESQEDCMSRADLGCVYQPNDTGCRSDDSTCTPGVCRDASEAFVRVEGRRFVLGGEPFRFVGVSSWALLPTPECGSLVPADEHEVWIARAYDDLIPSRAKVARFYAFQNAAGLTGKDFFLLDLSVRAARRAGVRLQLVLDHAAGACGLPPRDDAWYGGGYTKPEGTFELSYQEYALQVAERYKNEPTVLGYTLLQNMGTGDPRLLQSFVETMGRQLREVAPNQLRSLDLVWDNRPAYADLQQLEEVDYVDTDDYDFGDPSVPLRPELIATLKQIGKPAVVGEGAFRLEAAAEEGPDSFTQRADRARARMAQWKTDGFEGALFWAYQPRWEGLSEEFDLRPQDPMLQPNGVVDDAPW